MSAAPPVREPGLGELLGRLFGESRGVVSDYALLAVLDARRAAIRLALLLAAVLIAGVLVVTAWMALVAAGIVAMMGQGASWITALAVAALINLGGAAALAWWMRRLVVEMPFTALLRQLRGEAPEQP
ncbi:MAG TPA: phage holin family protein [Burkholderiales bacterium]|nr:phage holin family protein [Burkholderiales bacterium]